MARITSLSSTKRTGMALWEQKFQDNSFTICNRLSYLRLDPLWEFRCGCGSAHIAGRAPCRLKCGVSQYPLIATKASDPVVKPYEPDPCANYGGAFIMVSRSIRVTRGQFCEAYVSRAEKYATLVSRIRGQVGAPPRNRIAG